MVSRFSTRSSPQPASSLMRVRLMAALMIMSAIATSCSSAAPVGVSVLTDTGVDGTPILDAFMSQLR